MSDQALFADQHFSADHRADEVAVCNIAVQRTDGQAGQFRCRFARLGVGVMSPSLLQKLRSAFASLGDSTMCGVGGVVFCAANRPERSANRSGCPFISSRRASTSLIFREYTVAFENKRLFTQKTAVFRF